jgi:hypothetical protein
MDGSINRARTGEFAAMKLSVVEILKVGLSGLVFLLMFLFYRLLEREQKKTTPDAAILSSAKGFSWTCVFLILVVAGTSIFERYLNPGPTPALSEQLKECQLSLRRMQTLAAQGQSDATTLRTLIANHVAHCEPALQQRGEP